MSAETQAHAFEQFYRAADARSAAPDGSGSVSTQPAVSSSAMGGSIQVAVASSLAAARAWRFVAAGGAGG